MRKNTAILDILISGIMIGLACFFLKLALTGVTIDAFFIINLLLIPYIWIAAILAIIGFFFMQRAFYSGLISKIVPILAGLSIIIPVILAIVFLVETIGTIKIIAIVLIVSGILALSLVKK
jgi:uncharacterized membrane protein